jgi:hypothetical protein
MRRVIARHRAFHEIIHSDQKSFKVFDGVGIFAGIDRSSYSKVLKLQQLVVN